MHQEKNIWEVMARDTKEINPEVLVVFYRRFGASAGDTKVCAPDFQDKSHNILVQNGQTSPLLVKTNGHKQMMLMHDE